MVPTRIQELGWRGLKIIFDRVYKKCKPTWLVGSQQTHSLSKSQWTGSQNRKFHSCRPNSNLCPRLQKFFCCCVKKQQTNKQPPPNKQTKLWNYVCHDSVRRPARNILHASSDQDSPPGLYSRVNLFLCAFSCNQYSPCMFKWITCSPEREFCDQLRDKTAKCAIKSSWPAYRVRWRRRRERERERERKITHTLMTTNTSFSDFWKLGHFAACTILDQKCSLNDAMKVWHQWLMVH